MSMGERRRLGEARAGNRWWRWRSWRTLSQRGADADADAVVDGDVSLYSRLDLLCQQVAAYLPSVSISTRKAIFWCVGLLVAWRVILWALEMVVTSICFAVALLIVVCFLRPDLALVLLTRVLPPYVDAARGWLSAVFLSAGISLTRRPLVDPIPAPAPGPQPRAIEESLPQPPTAPPDQPAPAQRSRHTVHPRPHRAESQPALLEAAA